ncbi:hypothetical protein CCHL11_05788 [Colletotrichum chlorophyti]|uniref:Integral membrane protein n=1 Tax=Colletotrichum chlorophyti TaxID=708187 RepID=A0A1Q8RMR5_9PEZI|nr:hypothetical protein CCHL11_05788 [Colletotrichum chlorophyti]
MFDQLSTQLKETTLQDTTSSREAPLGPEDEEFHDWKRPIPLLTDHGKANDVIMECPEQRELDYEAEWYRVLETPDFLICTRCHKMYLSGTPFSASLERVTQPKGRCRFNVPRLTRLLLPEYLKHKDDRPIKAFMSHRLSVQDCKGQRGATGKAGIKWFQTTDARLSGFISCEACHEDTVLGTSFRHHFVAYDVSQPADNTWACDICIPFINRSLVKYSKRPVDSWEDWVQAAVKHMNLPQCEKKPVTPLSRQWMQLRSRPDFDLKICEKCFQETLAATSLEEYFEVVYQEPSATGVDWMDQALGYRTAPIVHYLCSATSLPVYVAIAAAKSQKDINVLSKALEVILPNPHCTGEGITNGTWYTLAGGGCDGYNICAACHAAYVATWELNHFYQPSKNIDSTQTILCSFSRPAPRWSQHMYRMQEAVETGVWPRYSGFVRKFDGIPPCAKEELVPSRKWYGWDDCTICSECYITFCRESSPAPGVEMAYNNEAVEDKRMCCLYSPRMRQKWIQACEKGSADELVEFSRLRHGVYIQTVLQVKMLRRMQELQMINAMHAGQMSVMYQGIESMRIVTGTTDGYQHGNSTLGWHATSEGATSAAFRNEMQAGMSQSKSASTWMMIAQLTEKWLEVE